jgi:hypothetical protein
MAQASVISIRTNMSQLMAWVQPQPRRPVAVVGWQLVDIQP